MSKVLAGVDQAKMTAAELEAAQRAAAESLDELRAEILAGESTGNPIEDYLIVNFGSINEADRVRYEGVNSLLKGKTGQILIVQRRVRITTVHRFVGPSDYEERDLCYIAILTGDELVFSVDDGKMTCTLPIDRYADQEHRLHIRKGTLSETGAHRIFTAGTYNDPPSNFRSLSSGDYRPRNLIIGDEEGLKWLERHRYSLFQSEAQRDQLLEALGRFTLSPMEADEPAFDLGAPRAGTNPVGEA